MSPSERKEAKRVSLGCVGYVQRLLVCAVAAGVFTCAVGGASAWAQGPWWHLESRAAPSNLPPGGEGRIIVSASNVGTSEASGVQQQITLSDVLPKRLTATAISGGGSYPEEEPPMSCSLEKLSCTYSEGVLPYKRLEVTISVKVAPGPPAEEDNSASIEGGGAPTPAPLSRPVKISPEPTQFGVENYELAPEEEDGLPDRQAGSHPFQLTATFDLNQTLAPGRFGEGPFPQAPALTRNLSFRLPPGLLGSPTAVPRCSDVDFATVGEDGFTDLCPSDTAVGAAVVTLYEPVLLKFSTVTVPLFNLTPAQGEPARFGFEVFKVPVVLDTQVNSSEGYSVSVSVSDASQAAAILGSQVTFWGEPAADSHDHARGWACLDLPFLPERASLKGCTTPSEHSNAAFLTLPTSCTGQALQSTVEGSSWPTAQAPQGLSLPPAGALLEPLEGCGQLPFSPSIAVEPDQHSTSTPSGMTVAVKLPQASTLDGGQLAESADKDTTVTLPEGVQLDPAAAAGLLACTGLQAGLMPGSEEALQSRNESFSEALPACPEEAKVASVNIKTPLLDHELQGAAYLASQDTSPFASPLVLYLLVHDPVSGVLVKLAGTVAPNPLTGQLTSTFVNTPQLPFEELRLHFFDGARASLSTPAVCGSYETQASFTPWSGSPPAGATSAFQITSGAEGGPCSNPQPLAPAFDAQSVNPQAGAFTPFSLNIAHRDQDQPLSAITMHLPPGMAAILASVTPCPEPQASEGSCPAASLIGHTTTSSGTGPEPFSLNGQVYLTGPYDGAPFGLSIVTPAVAGPFDLGSVVVRSAISVNPYTAAVTISGAIPTMVQTDTAGRTGIPVALKQLNVTIDRPDFEFNPTNCNPMSIAATLGGAQGASAQVSSRFQVADCQRLPFKPVFRAFTQGKTSKADGASLRIAVTSPGLGQVNIAKTTVTLPTTLPARLSTLQKACIALVFETNPASCPEGSVIGSAAIHTPVLKNALSGPAYLVSHGNVAFPDVEFVLQGEGLQIILDGKTNIKHGVTTSSFEALPDAPFTSFETTLPEGPHSALTTNLPASAKYNLCGQKLSMPIVIAAQNGASIKQNTKIAVSGCRTVGAAKTKKLSRLQLLKKALVTCRRGHKRSKEIRARCEKQARRRYRTEKSARRR